MLVLLSKDEKDSIGVFIVEVAAIVFLAIDMREYKCLQADETPECN